MTDWSDNFDQMSTAMYKLIERCPRKALLATSTVNPRHPIPNDQMELVNYMGSRKLPASKYIELKLSQILHFMKSVMFAIRKTFQILYFRIRYLDYYKALRHRHVDIVLKTWFMNDFNIQSHDFYLGYIDQLFKEMNYNVITIGSKVSQTGQSKKIQTTEPVNNDKISETLVLPVYAPLFALIEQIKTVFTLNCIAIDTDDRIFRLLLLWTQTECLNPITFEQLLHYYIAKYTTSIWQPKAYISLYEGQPWEKLAWLGVKNQSSSCTIIGYQHAVLMPHSLALIRPHTGSWEVSAPDIVLGLGDRTVDMMKVGHKHGGLETEFYTFGSFRYTGSDSIDVHRREDKVNYPTILVVPEGIMSEMNMLFGLALKYCELVSDVRVKFIFRCHPVLPFSRMDDAFKLRANSCQYIEISKDYTLDQDFERSSIVLHRGSSVVLYATLNGIFTCYYDKPGTPYIDPLYSLDSCHSKITNVDELEIIIDKYITKKTDETICSRHKEQAIEYVKSYVHPIKKSVVTELCELLG